MPYSYNDAESAFALRHQFDAEDEFDDKQPVKAVISKSALENGWASYGNYQLVRNGEKTNDMCGKYISLKGCLRTDLHDHIGLDGVDYTGKVFVKVVHHYCNKPSCPVCCNSGWAVREAHKIEERIGETAKRFGLGEHIVVSVPSSDRDLSYSELRKRVVKALEARHIVGGCIIFHGFRYSVGKHWYWSVHFHVIGFIYGGFKCRRCEKLPLASLRVCGGCHGFEARTRQMYKKDGCIVKVAENEFGEKVKRETIFGTAWYQLNHSTIDVTKKRFHVVTWFGVCSYRKLKITPQKKRELCPICSEELTKIWSPLPIVKEKGKRGYIPKFFDSLQDANGFLKYFKVRSDSYGYVVHL